MYVLCFNVWFSPCWSFVIAQRDPQPEMTIITGKMLAFHHPDTELATAERAHFIFWCLMLYSVRKVCLRHPDYWLVDSFTCIHEVWCNCRIWKNNWFLSTYSHFFFNLPLKACFCLSSLLYNCNKTPSYISTMPTSFHFPSIFLPVTAVARLRGWRLSSSRWLRRRGAPSRYWE